jgi:hypothetical protein
LIDEFSNYNEKRVKEIFQTFFALSNLKHFLKG